MAFSAGFPIALVGTFSLWSLVQLLSYARKDAPPHTFLTAYAAFIITFGSAVLLPYDICLTVDLGHYDPSIRYLWKVMYWSLWTMNWIFFAIFIEQQRTGSWRVSLRNNAIYWVGYLVAGFIMFCYYIINVGYHGFWDMYNFFYAMSYAFSNAYGLVLISLLLGYAFVALPQHLENISEPAKYINILYARVVASDENRLTTKFDLEDRFSVYRQSNPGETNAQGKAMIASVGKFLNRSLNEQQSHLRTRRDSPSATEPLTQQNTALPAAVSGNATLGLVYDGYTAAEAAICKFNQLVSDCIEIEDYLAGSIPEWKKKARKMKTWIYKTSSMICWVLSISIIVAQATIFIPAWWLSAPALVYRSLVLHYGQDTNSEIYAMLMQVVVAIPLTYAYLASFWAAFRFKLFNSYGLYPNHNTSGFSLMWCSSVMSRIAFSLCYNYIFVLRMQNDSKDTAFMNTMKKLSMVPLFGATFVTMLPFLIMVLAVLQYTRTYHKLIHWLGLSMLDMESAVYVGAGDAIVNEGKAIVARERMKRSQNLSEALNLGNPRTSNFVEGLTPRKDGSNKYIPFQ